MPTITLRYFAIIRETVGAESEDRLVPDGTTAAEVAADLGARYPRIAGLLRSSPVMVNAAYADLKAPLNDGDEVAFIPPVAGGVTIPAYVVTADPLEIAAVTELVTAPEVGAIVTFVGTVRNHARGRRCCGSNTKRTPQAVCQFSPKSRRRCGRSGSIVGVAIHHRVGHLQVGDTSVVIAVSSGSSSGSVRGL